MRYRSGGACWRGIGSSPAPSSPAFAQARWAGGPLLPCIAPVPSPVSGTRRTRYTTRQSPAQAEDHVPGVFGASRPCRGNWAAAGFAANAGASPLLAPWRYVQGPRGRLPRRPWVAARLNNSRDHNAQTSTNLGHACSFPRQPYPATPDFSRVTAAGLKHANRAALAAEVNSESSEKRPCDYC